MRRNEALMLVLLAQARSGIAGGCGGVSDSAELDGAVVKGDGDKAAA